MMKVKDKLEEIEAKYGMSIDDIAIQVPFGDLEIEEAVVVQVVINFNHLLALNSHGQDIALIIDAIFADDDDEAGPCDISMFG